MKQIILTQGKFTLIDDDVYEWAKDYKWYAIKALNTFYAVRKSSRKDNLKNKRPNIYLHHCVIGQPFYGFDVNHIDGNGLNNQKSNLEIITHQQNNSQSYKHRNGRLIGTYLVIKRYKDAIYTYWAAQIRINGKQKHLGYFKTEKLAHEIYMKALQELKLI